MGSFWGHIDEGLFFIVIALWWMINAFREYIVAECNEKPMKPNIHYNIRCKKEIPVEIVCKIIFPTVGFLGELIDSKAQFIDEKGEFDGLIYQQHMTIYAIFILHGLTDLFTFLQWPVFPSMNYMSACLSFLWYGVAFYYHAQMHGKEPVEQIVHEMPIWVMFVTSIAILLETKWREGVWTMVTRSYCVLTLGTWFSHVAFILYVHDRFPGGEPSNLDRSDPNNVLFCKAMFGLHLFANLIITVFIYFIVYVVLHIKMGIRLQVSKAYIEEKKNMLPLQKGEYKSLPVNGRSVYQDIFDECSNKLLLEEEA